MKPSSLTTLCSLLGLIFISGIAYAALSGSLNEKQILLRLQPEAQVNVIYDSGDDAPKPTTTADIGQQKYEETCRICHDAGIGGAPKFADKAEWGPRIAEGMDILVKHAIEGYKAMPPRGSCMTCTDEEIKKAVEYMILKAK